MPMTKLLDNISNAAQTGTRLIIAGANLHGLYISLVDEEYRMLLEQTETVTIVDGMPILWLLRALGYPLERDVRTTWVDWFAELLSRAAREGRSVFVLGHDDDILASGLEAARRSHANLRIGAMNGYFDLEDEATVDGVVARINAFAPDILIVGMGMPRQERFVHRYGHRLCAPVIGLGGAAFAYYAGYEPTPPRWMGRWGLEWLHRLCADPKRMAGRYLIEPVALSFLLLNRALAPEAFRGSRPGARQ
jgi:N-acetylglucosaminyldiphosphoundecaprenol N-acetyl-beta-D-mannosaminyltransferase